jgi:hypothetical protein
VAKKGTAKSTKGRSGSGKFKKGVRSKLVGNSNARKK